MLLLIRKLLSDINELLKSVIRLYRIKSSPKKRFEPIVVDEGERSCAHKGVINGKMGLGRRLACAKLELA